VELPEPLRLRARAQASNNFVLQAATRCLRQVLANIVKARVYLSADNFTVLDRQLQETYGETIAERNQSGHETRRARIILRKLDLPPLVVTQLVRIVVKKQGVAHPLQLERPKYSAPEQIGISTHTIAEQQATSSVLRQVGHTVTIEAISEATDAYAAAVDLAARYRLDLWMLYDELRRLYGPEDIPASHTDDLARQIEEQTRFYEVHEEKVDVALALVKPDGFLKDTDATGTEIYTADIVYPKDREKYLKFIRDFTGRPAGELSFHYEPYNFDSSPEIDFLDKILTDLGESRDSVEGVYFTGALTDPAKTDFFIEYKDDKGKWRRYTPDFIIRRKPKRDGRPGSGKVFIVEIKREHDRAHPVDGENGRKALALRRWEGLNPDRLRYQMLFTATDTVTFDQMKDARAFVEEADA
jgi:type III restriction enzyme